MTCQEFRDNLDEYLDETLEPRVRARAMEHVAACAECRLALSRAQSFGQVMQHALHRAAADVLLTPELKRRIALAARENSRKRPALLDAWEWLTAHPFRALGTVATLAAIVLLDLQLSRVPDETHTGSRAHVADAGGYLIDVPFRTETRVFRLQDDAVIDAVLTSVTHVEYRAAKRISSSSR